MDKYRVWKRPRRKRRLLAMTLVFCLLFTIYPNIWETMSVFAAGTQSEDGIVYLTGYAQLLGEVREQTIPVGTGEEELTLPKGYALMEGVSLPQITVTVQADSVDSVIQALLERIAALPDSEEYLAKEPDTEEEEAYAEWMEGLYQYLADHSSHPVCGASCSHSGTHGSFSWQPFTSTGGELGPGNYYLTGDVSLQTQLTIPSGTEVNLCLNGCTLCGSNAVIIKGMLTICDCSTGGTGVLNCGDSNNTASVEGGVLNLYGGKLTGNSPSNIIYVHSGSTVNLYGGMVEGGSQQSIKNDGTVIISGNAVVSGGEGSFDCAVLNNKLDAVLTVKDNARLSSEGSGVCSYGTVNIEGGAITGKGTAGYGINNKEGILNITSGMITGNKYGVYMDYDAAMNLSGSPEISGSTADLRLYTSSGAALDNAMVNATGYTGDALSAEECNTSDREGAYAIKVSEGNKDKFTLTNVGEVVYQYKDGGLMLHTHSYTYAASGEVITESCSCGHEETATLSLQRDAALTYTGSAIKPVTVSYSDGWVGTGGNKPNDSAIIYKNNTSAGSTAIAELTISDVTASLNFTIDEKNLTGSMITVISGPHYYTGSPITPEVTVYDGDRNTGLKEGTDYTVSYENNINVHEGTDTATVKINGMGNYTGTLSETFTIEYRQLPDDSSLTDYITISPSLTNGWYGSNITLTPINGCGVGETPANIGSNAVTISQETGTDGSTKTIEIYIKDTHGDIYQTEFTYKLDKTQPVVDLTGMTVENGTTNLLDWIIGKKSMIIKIPVFGVTDALSGVAEVTYTAQPDNGTAQSGTLTAKDGYYQIAFNTQFSGTIQLTAKDNAGNTKQASLTTGSGKVIAEDYAPVVTFALPVTPTPNADGWYNTAVTITVTVTDNKDSSNNAVTSGGIAGIRWKDGENGTVQTVTGLPGNSPVCEKELPYRLQLTVCTLIMSMRLITPEMKADGRRLQ